VLFSILFVIYFSLNSQWIHVTTFGKQSLFLVGVTDCIFRCFRTKLEESKWWSCSA